MYSSQGEESGTCQSRLPGTQSMSESRSMLNMTSSPRYWSEVRSSSWLAARMTEHTRGTSEASSLRTGK